MKRLMIVSVIIFFVVSLLPQEIKKTTDADKNKFIDIGNCKISYEMKGEGIPLIMIHGGALDKRMWDAQFYEFAKYFKVLRYDARKHGLTQSEPVTFSHHEDLSLLMEKLGIKKAVIMGLSMGGYAVIDFALTYPEKVIALIPVAPGLTGFQFTGELFNTHYDKLRKVSTVEEAVELVMEMWTDGPFRKPNQLDSLMRSKAKLMYSQNLASSFNGRYKEMRTDPPAINRLSEIKVPTLTIYGDLDAPGIIEICGLIEKQVPGAKSKVIKNTAHLLNMEKPEEFNKIVIDYIRSLKIK